MTNTFNHVIVMNNHLTLYSYLNVVLGKGHSHSREHLIGQKSVKCRMSHHSCSVVPKEIYNVFKIILRENLLF